MLMWNPESVLFEMSWCVMLYTTVLAIDVFIMALERWRAEFGDSFFRNIYVFLIVAGIILSTLHQSSLGALYLLLPEKMSNLCRPLGLLFLFHSHSVLKSIAGLPRVGRGKIRS